MYLIGWVSSSILVPTASQKKMKRFDVQFYLQFLPGIDEY